MKGVIIAVILAATVLTIPFITTQTITQEITKRPSGGGGGISALRLYNLTVENITNNSADIVWKTSRTSITELTYWSSPEVIIKDKSYNKEHLIHLENLEDDTTYYFQIVCKDRYGLKRSDDGEFTTLKEVVPELTSIPPEPEEPEEPVKPIEPEPEEPITEPEPEQETHWRLIVGIVGGLIIAIAGIIYWRKRIA